MPSQSWRACDSGDFRSRYEDRLRGVLDFGVRFKREFEGRLRGIRRRNDGTNDGPWTSGLRHQTPKASIVAHAPWHF